MPKHNATGRSKSEPPYVMLRHWIMGTPAFKSLSPQARAVYLEIIHRYNGHNNGRIGLSVRDAARLCNIASNTAKRCFDELIERGFIVRVTPGGFSRKVRHATEWRLTDRPCDITGESPSQEFRRWQPQNRIRSQKVLQQSQNKIIAAMKEALSDQVSHKIVPDLIPSKDFSVAK